MMNRIAGKKDLHPLILSLSKDVCGVLILLITVMPAYLLMASTDALNIEYNLIIPKKKIYIGEKLNFELRFKYPANQYVRLRSIQDPEIPGISQLKITGPQVREEMQNNMRYREFVWQGSCVPDRPGQLVIPALKAVCNVNWDMHELYSKPEAIQVQKLPQEIAINGMGSFKKIELTAEKKEMQSGTAQKIVVRVDGTACGSVQAPKLGVPDGLKYYESTSDVAGSGQKLQQRLQGQVTQTRSAEESRVYTFEYIVQAVKPGEYKINAQEFVFFDPEIHKYTRLKSNELSLQVHGVAAPVGSSKLPEIAGDNEPASSAEKEFTREELIAQKIGQIQRDKRSYALPWWLFIMLLVLPGLPVCVNLVYTGYNYYWPVNYRQSRNAFRAARKYITHAAQQHNRSALYGIITRALAQRCNMPDITDEIIACKLKEAGCPELLTQWKQFSIELLSPEFGENKQRDGAQVDSESVFVTARELISRFEKIL